MAKLKRMFFEFKSIFVSEDILKENEQHANIVAAATMLNVFWLCLLAWFLTYFNVFKLGMDIMNTVMVRAMVLLAIPAVICYINKGKGEWIKHMLFICFTIMVAMADAILKYNVTIIMAIPIILSARYYNKKFTIGIAILTSILFALSAYMSVNIGQQDINTYNLIVPSGTTIKVDGTLRDAVTSQANVNEELRLKNVFIHFFIPKLLLFNIIAFACAQIAQSGKNMVDKQTEIAKKGASVETELGLASAIQKGMLPSKFPAFPEHQEIDIYAQMTPARDVGGDFYDMFLVDDNHLALCMADVSGKGIPASLLMMVSKILLKNVTLIDADVTKALTRVNKMLCEGNRNEFFVTCWFGILDLRNGHMEFANAGHNPPLLYSKKRGTFEYLDARPNIVLAGFDNTQYKKNEIQIEPGDRLFLYTDGVTEAIDANYSMYGSVRLKEFLNSHLEFNSYETITSLKNDIEKFVGKADQFDDITMMELLYYNEKRTSDFAQQTFSAEKGELPKVHNYVREELGKHNYDTQSINKIDVAIEEIFVNIASYAYPNGKGTCDISLIFNGNNKLQIIFEDTGVPFNPLEKADPDTKKPAEQRDIGGLGIYITKQTMDNVEYHHEDNKNVLILTKNM